MGQKRKRITVPGFVPTSNPEQAHWNRERGKSNATQPHVALARKGTRRSRVLVAIREQY